MRLKKCFLIRSFVQDLESNIYCQLELICILVDIKKELICLFSSKNASKQVLFQSVCPSGFCCASTVTRKFCPYVINMYSQLGGNLTSLCFQKFV